MVVVPAISPLITPVEPTVATVVLLLLHVPLPPVSIVVLPVHTAIVPPIGAGRGFTVTIVVALHPAPSEYEIVVVPEITPFTTPVEPIVATAVLLLAQLPPPRSLSVVVVPAHR